MHYLVAMIINKTLTHKKVWCHQYCLVGSKWAPSRKLCNLEKQHCVCHVVSTCPILS